MDRCPAEVLHWICSLLTLPDLAAARFSSRPLAVTGAHYLLRDGRLRFHCSAESLARLQNIASHPILRQQVVKLHYESSWLTPLRSVDAYKQHMRSIRPHHQEGPPPARPPQNAGSRERRLFKRNMQKWLKAEAYGLSRKELKVRQIAYMHCYSEQRQITAQKLDEHNLLKCAPRFPRLLAIVFTNDAKCAHGVSGRFLERFPRDFFPALQHDTSVTVSQIRSMLAPIVYSALQLKTLRLKAVTPRIFGEESITPSIRASFASLKELYLTMRLENRVLDDVQLAPVGELYSELSNAHLHQSLIHAPHLEVLHIEFDDYHGYDGACCNVKIFGNHTWPSLRDLDICFVEGTTEDYLQCFKHQPSLRVLGLGLATVTTGRWADLLEQMRRQLDLVSLNFQAFLRDAETDEWFDIDHVEADSYSDDPDCPTTLATAIDMFVTKLDCKNMADDSDDYGDTATHYSATMSTPVRKNFEKNLASTTKRTLNSSTSRRYIPSTFKTDAAPTHTTMIPVGMRMVNLPNELISTIICNIDSLIDLKSFFRPAQPFTKCFSLAELS